MSMFFMVNGFGNYSHDYNWDSGVDLGVPVHVTKTDISDFYPEGAVAGDFYYPVSTDKAACRDVQTMFLNEHGGSRDILLLVKAKGYQQAKERAQEFVDRVYPAFG